MARFEGIQTIEQRGIECPGLTAVLGMQRIRPIHLEAFHIEMGRHFAHHYRVRINHRLLAVPQPDQPGAGGGDGLRGCLKFGVGCHRPQDGRGNDRLGSGRLGHSQEEVRSKGGKVEGTVGGHMVVHGIAFGLMKNVGKGEVMDNP